VQRCNAGYPPQVPLRPEVVSEVHSWILPYRTNFQRQSAFILLFSIAALYCVGNYYFRFPQRESVHIHANHRLAQLSPSSYPLDRVIPLVSRTNAWGLMESIDFNDRSRFNPSLLSIPIPDSDPNKNPSFAMVVRDLDNTLYVEDGDYFTGTRSISAWLLDAPEFNDKERHRNSPLGQFSINAHSHDPLDTVVTANESNFPHGTTAIVEDYCRSIAGPEDPRLFWSHLGEPLLLYNSVGAFNSIHCRHLYLVDFRTVYPALNEILPAHFRSSPIRFQNSTPLIYDGQHSLQKNWAPFTDISGQVYLHTHLIPQTIYRISPHRSTHLPDFSSPATELSILEPVVVSTSHTNCITNLLGSSLDFGDTGAATEDFEIHHATQFLEVVLCTSSEVLSGSCDEDDPRNRIYMSLFHVVHSPNQRPRYYERRVITLNAISPFEYLSISKPLMFRRAPFPKPSVTFMANR
jgi:hypothetical protein